MLGTLISVAFPLGLAVSFCFIEGVATMLASLLFLLDALSRFKEYRKLKTKAFCKRRAYLLKGSRCQRNVAIAAWGRKARDFYNELGYKWYYVIPDTLLKEPTKVFSKKYLKATFFKIT